MTNRYLRRQLAKHLSLETADDLDVVLRWLEQAGAQGASQQVRSFAEGFQAFLTSLERSYDEFDRTVHAREVSLEIAETELNKLNLAMQHEAEKRTRVLARLQEIVSDLDAGPRGLSSEDMEQLTTAVSALVRSHQERIEDLHLIHAQSLRFSRAKSWAELGQALTNTVCALLGTSAEVRSFGIGGTLRHGAPTKYFELHDFELRRPRGLTRHELESIGTWRYEVNTGSEAPPVVLCVSAAAPSPSARQRFEGLFSALGVTVMASCELIRFVAEVLRRSQLEAELNTARLVQQTLLPPPQANIAGVFTLHARTANAAECGGDWWGIYPLHDGRHLVLVGDVSGHGTGSALVAAVVKGFLDAAVRDTNVSLQALLVDLDIALARISPSSPKTMSLVALAFEPTTRTMEIASAGHPPIYHARRGASAC